MDNKTKGAWIIHHKNKLDTVSGAQSDFEDIILAGKCSVLLSSISCTNENELDNARLYALAAAVGINRKLELPNILSTLDKQRLINIGKQGIAVLGLTTSSVLEYTTQIYNENEPNDIEESTIFLSEKASESPIVTERAKEYISDVFNFDQTTTDDIIDRGKRIGFFDYESIRTKQELLFNGNLFRNSDMTKVASVLASLTSDENRIMTECNQLLDNSGCLPLEDIVKISGTDLFNKLQSIGLYDVSSVANESGECLFVTRPSSFCKFTSSQVDDAFDLAKAFVSSLTFGMLKSTGNRGKIRMIEALMRNLINGYWVGPATAIGQDYKILELKGVVQVKQEKNGLFSMKLLKKEVGELALAVIQDGSAVSGSLSMIPSANVSTFLPPEHNRAITRKKLTAPLKKSVSEILDSIRTGDLQ